MQAECKGKNHSCDIFTVGKFKRVTEKLIVKNKNNNTNLHTLSHTRKYTTHRFTTDSLMQLTSRMWISGLDKPRGSWPVSPQARAHSGSLTALPAPTIPQRAGRDTRGLGLRLLQEPPWTWPIPPICPWSDLTARLVVTGMVSRAKVSPWGGWAAWRGFVIHKLPAEQKAAEGY